MSSTPPPISPPLILEVAQFLQTGLVQAVYSGLINSFFFALYLTVALQTLYILTREGFNTTAKKAMLGVVVLMFALSAIDFSTTIYLIWYNMQQGPEILTTGVIPSTPSIIGRLTILSIFTRSINFILGDLVVLWRACVVWFRNKAVMGISFFLALALLVCWIVALVNQVFTETGRQSLGDPHITVAFAYGFSFICSAWATGAIAYRIWQRRSMLKLHMVGYTRRNAVENVMAMFVECGVVYSIIVFLFLMSSENLWGQASEDYYQAAMTFVVPLYPLFIIILVAKNKAPSTNQLTYIEPPTIPKSPDPLLKEMHEESATAHLPEVLKVGNTFDSSALATSKENSDGMHADEYRFSMGSSNV